MSLLGERRRRHKLRTGLGSALQKTPEKSAQSALEKTDTSLSNRRHNNDRIYFFLNSLGELTGSTLVFVMDRSYSSPCTSI